ncbi:MAG: hypothetical protein OIF58_05300 [Cohaesibacter sp.]|nr:hypothetical protein [Cohaesibacter sp.]
MKDKAGIARKESNRICVRDQISIVMSRRSLSVNPVSGLYLVCIFGVFGLFYMPYKGFMAEKGMVTGASFVMTWCFCWIAIKILGESLELLVDKLCLES